MRVGRRALNELAGVLLLFAMMPPLAAQQGGFIAGVVRERSGPLIPGAEVRIQSEITGARQKTSCDAQGKYVSSELQPGDYKITVRAQGFRTISATGVRVQPGHTREADFIIDLLPLVQEVTVESAHDENDPTASGLAVSRESSASALPMNGRDLHALYGLMPGAAITPAVSSDGGQFTVDGQRPNTNTFRIDGINGNTGIGISALPGALPGSSLPGMTVIGSTQSLASKEEIERVEMLSSDFAPEYGDRPGAQVLIETRSGANDFHGSIFGYLRPRALDSGDWFAQKYHAPLPPASLHGYGASLSGALWPNRTFFFAAFEKVTVNDTALQLMPTPSLAARAAAPANYQPLLNAFPLPQGPQLSAYDSLAAVALDKQAGVTNYSMRIDQALRDKARVFARYSNVPSQSTTQQLGITDARFGWMSATAGVTFQSAGAIHDLRFNYSFVRAGSSWAAANGAEQTAIAAFSSPAPYYEPGNVVTALSIAGVGQVLSGHEGDSVQRQWEGAYTAAKPFGRHDVRAGADFIALFPRTLAGADVPTESVVAPSVEALLAGDALGLTLSSGRIVGVSGRIPIGSVFVQDTYKASQHLTVLYGVRWEITHPSDSGYSTAFDFGSWDGADSSFNLAGSFYDINRMRWPMRFGQIAPRIGLAYRPRTSAWVFRLGAGIFYDDALGSLINPVNLSPLNSWVFVPGEINTNPGAPVTPLPSTPVLFLPQVWEWRASVERAIGERSTLSLSYVGSQGRRLLREDATLLPGTQIPQSFAFASDGASDYDALVAQFRGHITPSLYTLVSYTWGHSIDTGSQDSSIFLAGPSYGNADRGSSSFDIRHNVSASLTYLLPGPHAAAWPWLAGWNLSSTMEAHTGFPFDVTSLDRSIGLGFANSARPNLVSGVPLWIQDSALPDGRELNPAAFQPAVGAINGTLGRNVLTGPGLFQIDASLRKQFRLRGAAVLEVNASAFNLFNHSAFSNPIGYLGSALFGQPASMQNLMLGSGNPNGGLSPVFQAGGPRTVELNLKFSF